jgi:hypothetical protein
MLEFISSRGVKNYLLDNFTPEMPFYMVEESE